MTHCVCEFWWEMSCYEGELQGTTVLGLWSVKLQDFINDKKSIEGSDLTCLAWAAISLSNTCGLLVFLPATTKTRHSEFSIQYFCTSESHRTHQQTPLAMFADSQPSRPSCCSHRCVRRDWGQGVWNCPLSVVVSAATQSWLSSHCHAPWSQALSPQQPPSISTCSFWHPDVVSFSVRCLKAEQQITSCWCLHFSTIYQQASVWALLSEGNSLF